MSFFYLTLLNSASTTKSSTLEITALDCLPGNLLSMAPSRLRQEREVEFLDIRREKREQSLLQATLDGLDPSLGDARSLPTLLLYDGQC